MARPTNDERHREVLDVATVIIRERGLHAASMNDIAVAAGMSKSTLFNYFSSKGQLVERLQERLSAIARDELATVADDLSLGPVQRLRALLHIHANHCVQRLSSPVLVAFIQEWGPPTSEHGRQQVEARRAYERFFEEAFTQCVESGIFAVSDVRVRTLGLLGMMTWMAMWYRPDDDAPIDELVDDLLDMVVDGLRA